jgi:Flp pilus assembly protein TadG
MIGVWLSILLAIGFIGVYAWQITEESRQLADALAATELVLAREQHSRNSTVWRPPPRTSSARRCRPSR